MKNRLFFPGGIYGDCLPSGEYAFIQSPQWIVTHQAEPIHTPAWMLFARITNKGGFKIATKDHDADVTWLWKDSWEQKAIISHGTQGHAFDGSGQLRILPPAANQDSQGLRYWDPSAPAHLANKDVTGSTPGFVTGSPTYGHSTDFAQSLGVKLLFEWTHLGDGIFVGQGPNDNDGTLIQYQGQLYVLEPGNSRFVQGHQEGNQIAVAISKFGEGVVLHWLEVSDILLLDKYQAIVIPDVIVTPPPPQEPKPMEPVRLPERVQKIVEALYERNLRLAHSNNDDDRRILARMIAEQTCFELGDEWGWKSNHGIGISPAKDAIAKRLGPVRLNERQPLLIWDLFNGSTRKPNERPFSEPEHESSQFFIPVEPVNHLAVAPPKPQEPTVPVPNPGPIVPNSGTVVVDVNPALAPLKAEIAALKLQLADLREELEELADRPAPEAPKVKMPRRVALRSRKNGKLLCVDVGDAVMANRDVLDTWEQFEFIVVE